MISAWDDAGVVILRWLSVDAADPSPLEMEAPSSAAYPFVFAAPLMPFVFARGAVCCDGDEDVFAGSAWLFCVPLTAVSEGLVILYRKRCAAFSLVRVCERRKGRKERCFLSMLRAVGCELFARNENLF